MLRQFATFSIALLAVMMVISSCSDSSTNSTGGNPPAVPPETSMAMDFSNFDAQSKAPNTAVQAKNNFGQAVVRAGLLKAIVDINLALPRAFLKAASESDVQYNENGEWEWAYNTSKEENDYGVRLTAARDQAGDASWNFYVTNSNLGLEDELFFSGVSMAQGTTGSWSYYSLLDAEGKGEKVSQITWAANAENDLSLRLEVVSDRNDNLGDYIDYTFEGTTKTAVYYDAGKNQETTLEWDVETKAGSITAPGYNNGDKACWDENFEDIPCSE
ncbi:hypothetical protein [Fodinibius salsisoli]|uniref:Lipoprotein n=1 Tax=Fodinibius salsisoli TaxID=2820877 RepID=A0ABT3PJ76_9BACT|nr:hypothetical protein [Fodinibius salsisoli]MCW9705993.1 hypothetical protein [Fodinibius salsisoli]